MRPFVLIATRAEDDAADTEYETFCRLTGLAPEQLLRIRLEREPLPELDLEQLSGIILGGSPYNASDPASSKSAAQLRAEAELAGLMDRVIAEDLPLFGACYGVGALGTHQGAIIDRTYGEQAGAITVRLTEEGKADPLIREAGLPDEFLALVGHKEAVRELPPHAVHLGRGEACPVQMFRIGTRQYATQFHPELDSEGLVVRAGIYREHGYFEPAEFEELAARVRSVKADESAALLSAFVRLYAR
ncbi:glutamine amidotransferase [Brachybacterium hainanense]|uniref:Glutamine amidotransferase n=1 Tax=Brachybacterium hainanense TaxID=1541174 RepID=A0ABV6R6C9_9MICO